MSKNNMKNAEETFQMEPEYNFSGGVRGRFYTPHKKSTTIRLDDDVLLYFKKMACEKKIGYQTLMNSALREYINAHGVKENQ